MTKVCVAAVAVAACMVGLGGCPSDKSTGNEQGKLGADAGGSFDGGGTEPGKDAGTITSDSGAPGKDAATASGGASYPKELGFDLDGNWYAQDMNKVSCGATVNVNGSTYYANQWGINETPGGAAVFYVSFFGDKLEAGTYPANIADPTNGIPKKGEVSIRINDARDMSSYWDTDGEGGTVTVVDAGGGAFDVLWHDVTFVRAAGSIVIAPGEKIVSLEGWLSCKPM